MGVQWPTQEVDDWYDFTKSIDEFAKPRGDEVNRFLYRGQADAVWPLKPSVMRRCERYGVSEGDAKWCEFGALTQFKAQAHLYLGPSPVPEDGDRYGWWQIMQHYGVPTRLLDWTKSPYVAAYLAVVEESEKDGAIWVVDPGAVADRMEEQRVSGGRRLKFMEAPRPTNRMVAQQGWFSIVEDSIFADHGDVIANAVRDHFQRRWIMKFVIPARDKQDFLLRLRTMNITAATLFPGIDGFGQSIGEIFQIGPLVRAKDWM